MGRLIDADALLCRIPNLYERREVSRWVDGAPTVDAVPVVRCKYCRWGRKVSGNIECFADRNAPPEYHGYDWYCPNGERRTDE